MTRSQASQGVVINTSFLTRLLRKLHMPRYRLDSPEMVGDNIAGGEPVKRRRHQFRFTSSSSYIEL